MLEVLVAIVVIAAGLTFIVRSYFTALHASVNAVDYSTVMTLMDGKLQNLLAQGYIRSGLDVEKPFSLPYEKYQYRLTARNIPQNGLKGGINEVSLQCRWATGRKKNDITLTTYLHDVSNE